MNWVCKYCSTNNTAENETCFVCGKQREADMTAEKTSLLTAFINKLRKMFGLPPRG